MNLIADRIGKKFNREWIFKDISFHISKGQSMAITGANGSGKSTLLQILAGAMPATTGSVSYSNSTNLPISHDNFYSHIALAAPYLELIEEMTIPELAAFQHTFKPFYGPVNSQNFAEHIQLSHAIHKPIRLLSSGMKQRVKLGLALFADTPVLLLDEPTTNLDTTASAWYRTEVLKCLPRRLVIICSNLVHEYDFCEKEITIKK